MIEGQNDTNRLQPKVFDTPLFFWLGPQSKQ
jgi:hypothetical protein